jgi:DNA-binding SARP family transcriptional activator/predicted ATPase
MSPLLKIHTLGGLSILYDEQPLTGLVSRKAEALLVYLAVNQFCPQSREMLSAMLWDDRSQEQALTNLRVLVNSLKKHLAPFITITRTTLALNPQANIWIDAISLDHTIQSGSKWTEKNPLGNTAFFDQLAKALELYHGDFLFGYNLNQAEQFEDWILSEREHLRSSVITAYQNLITYRATKNDLALAVRDSNKLIRLDRTNENAHRWIMQLLAQNGQVQTALAHYESYQKWLAVELKARPEVETSMLYEQIRKGSIPAVNAYHNSARKSFWISDPAFLQSDHSSKPDVKTWYDAEIVANAPQKSEINPYEFIQTTGKQPTFLHSFIGRSSEMAWIDQNLQDPDCRLIAITGPGGVGKSRLAIEAAARNQQLFPDGVHLVCFSDPDPSINLQTSLARSLGLKPIQGLSLTRQIISFLQHRQILLILDEFERPLIETPEVTKFINEAPGIKIIITSRQNKAFDFDAQLNLTGLPCATSSNIESAQDLSAVQLFIECSWRVNQSFHLTKDDLTYVLSICKQVDGLPLGIELAAACTYGQTCQQIAADLRNNLDILDCVQTDQQKSLRTAFESSWQMLSTPEQNALSRLSVFNGVFTPQAALAVSKANSQDITALANKSLLHSTYSGLHFLSTTIRLYAAEKLAENQAVFAQNQERYLFFYSELLIEQGAALMEAGTIPKAVNRIEFELSNIENAWNIATSAGKFSTLNDLLIILFKFFQSSGRLKDGYRFLMTLTTRLQARTELSTENSQLLARSLDYLGWFQLLLGQVRNARETLEKCEQVLQTLSDSSTGAQMAHDMISGQIQLAGGNIESAISCFENALSLARQIGDLRNEAFAQLYLARIAIEQNREAGELLEFCGTTFQQLQNQRGYILALILQGQNDFLKGNIHEARCKFEKALAAKNESIDPLEEALSLYHLGLIFAAQGQTDMAIELQRSALSIFHTAGILRGCTGCLCEMGELTLLNGNQEEALEYFCEALSTCSPDDIPTFLELLTSSANFLELNDRPNQALELLAFSFNHPSSKRLNRQRAWQKIEHLREILNKDVYDAAWKEASELNLYESKQVLENTFVSHKRLS